MKKGRIKLINRAVCFGVTLAMLPTMWSAAAGQHDGKLTDRVKHTDKKFKDFEYGRMDEKDFDEIIDGLDDLAADAASADAVLDVIIAMEDYYNEMKRNASIAHIKSDLVADDKYWDDEVQYFDDLGTSVADKIMKSYRTIAYSVNSDVLHDRVDDEDDWQDILDYVDMTQEQKDLSAKETELSLQYDILYNQEYTTTISGKKYNTDELNEAYENASIGRSDFLSGYADIMKQKNKDRAELYIELVQVRDKIAESYGYDSYVDYGYEKGFGRDYTYDELKAYRQDIIDYMIPAQDELTLQLYGYYYDQLKEAFEQKISEQECFDIMYKYLPKISNDMIVSLDYMIDHELYDLSVSDVKAPGGYTMSIEGYNAPFMYNCADGTYSDMRTVIHEFGHYNELYYMTEDSWYYGNTDIDIAEIHSQGLEMLFMDFAEDIYGDYADLMNLYTCFNLIYATVEGAKEDYFQYLVYSDPDNLTVDKLNQLYYQACMEYSGSYTSMLSDSLSLSSQGYLDQGVCLEWVEVPHTFQSPMYYISYSVSAAAVFELFDSILDDRDAGIDVYLDLVDAEFQEGLFDTLANAGINNPITNPRFDIYASDLLYYLGLADERIVDPSSQGSGSGTQADPLPTSPDQPVDEPDNGKDTDKNDNADDDDEDDEDADVVDNVGVSKGVIAALVVIGVLFIIVLIILIVILAKRGAEKRAKKLGSSGQGNIPPGGYIPVSTGMPNEAGAPGMGGAPGMSGAPGGMPGRAGIQGNPYMQQQMPQGNPYVQQAQQQMPQGNPYVQQAQQQMPQGNPYMQQQTQQQIPQDNPYMQQTAAVNRGANSYLQGNPYAGFGINQPSGGMKDADTPDASAVGDNTQIAENTQAAENVPVTESIVTDAAVDNAARSLAETSPVLADAALNSQSSPYGTLGPQPDERPAATALGELKSVMPYTAPNPYLQNLENMKKNEEGGSDT